MEYTSELRNADDTRSDGAVDSPADATSSGLGLAFTTWHRLLRTLLLVHVPLLAMFAYFREVDTAVWAPLVAVPALLVLAASTVGSERFRAALISIGFVWCSWLLVFWSGGAIEAHFHALIVIGLVGLYRDWLALGIAVVAQLVLQLVVGNVDPTLIYNHEAAVNAPFAWSFVHVCAVLGAAAVPVFSWRGTREAEDVSAERASEATAQKAEVRRQREVSKVYATVARRSQTLLERQLDLIEKLEQDEKDPSTLQDLFSLDHLATRMNREAASLLVLAGGEPNRRVAGRPPLSEVARGAVGEIEDYTRVDLELADDRTVEGRIVAPLVHLLSELIENAASYSPPEARVRVIGGTTADGSYLLRILDRGIGIDEAKLERYNHLLANPQTISPSDSQRLGLDVVSRLAGRHGIPVQLSHNTDGPGIMATVKVPGDLLSEPASTVLEQAPPAADMPTPTVLEEEYEPQPDRPRDEPALPTTEPAPPVPVPSGAPVSASEPAPTPATGAPAWAQAVVRPPSTPAPATAAPTARTRDGRGGSSGPASSTTPATGPVPAPTSRAPQEPAGPAPSGGGSWSYSGHLGGRDTPSSEPPKKRRGMFGRKNRGESVPATPQPEAAASPTDEDMVPARDDLDALLSASRRTPTAPAATPQASQPATPSPGPAAPASRTPNIQPAPHNGPAPHTAPAPRTAPGQAETAAPAAAQTSPAPTPTPSPSRPAGSDADAGAPAARAEQPEAGGSASQAEAAARLLQDLPGMGDPVTPAPVARRKPVEGVGIPGPQGGRGPAVPPRQATAGEDQSSRPSIGASSPQAPPLPRRSTVGQTPDEPGRGLFTSRGGNASEDADPASPPEADQPSVQTPAADTAPADTAPANTAPADTAPANTAPADTPAADRPTGGSPAAQSPASAGSLPTRPRPGDPDPTPTAASAVPDVAAEAPEEPASGSPTEGDGDRPTSEIGTPLPQRRRGASLPAALKKDDDDARPAAAAAAPVSREQSRNLLSSYQSRLQAGRRAAEEQVTTDDAPPADGDGAESGDDS
ncbi:sensor histidine kinase [Euzebya pacifica]|uniref:sensor histidine kinase n=1 Tax=Euzebya pacifica TaxID=1608957 RepID=UPI0030F54AB2